MAVPAPVAVTVTTVAVAVLGPAPLASAGLAPAGRPAASTPTSRCVIVVAEYRCSVAVADPGDPASSDEFCGIRRS
jgi:hypothetical protein